MIGTTISHSGVVELPRKTEGGSAAADLVYVEPTIAAKITHSAVVIWRVT